MGVHAKQSELFAAPVSLAGRIPENHPLRRLKKALDLSFVREEVSPYYGKRGNISIDPVVLMKLMLLLFWDDHKSEHELLRMLPYRFDYLWYNTNPQNSLV